jgi:hypothetical protein
MNLQSTTLAKAKANHFYPTFILNMDVKDKKTHFEYQALLTTQEGKMFEIKIMPIYRSGTQSLTDMRGSARIEICEKRDNDWMAYRLVYTNICKSMMDLGRAVRTELNEALIQINVLSELEFINVEFKQENVHRCLSA